MLNNGLIMCFITSKNIRNTTIAYPISFTNTCTVVGAIWNETNPKGSDYAPLIYGKTLTKISFYLDYGGTWVMKNISFVVIGN